MKNKTLDSTTATNLTNGENNMVMTELKIVPNGTITTVDPRFQPVSLNGRAYITSTLLHKQKREGGMSKYERHDHFMRMIREIDCFGRLVENGDIIDLYYKSPIVQAAPDLGGVMKANYGNPLMLISPTAQKEIEHHLDDEASKESSIKSSTMSAVVDGGYGVDASFMLIKQLYQEHERLYGEYKRVQAIQQHQEQALTSSQVNNRAIKKELNETKAELLQINCRVTFDKWWLSKGFKNALSTTQKGKIGKLLESHGVTPESRYLNGCVHPTKTWKKGDLNDNFDRITAYLGVNP